LHVYVPKRKLDQCLSLFNLIDALYFSYPRLYAILQRSNITKL